MKSRILRHSIRLFAKPCQTGLGVLKLLLIAILARR